MSHNDVNPPPSNYTTDQPPPSSSPPPPFELTIGQTLKYVPMGPTIVGIVLAIVTIKVIVAYVIIFCYKKGKDDQGPLDEKSPPPSPLPNGEILCYFII